MTNRDKIINLIKKTLIPEARRYKQYLDNQKEISKDKLHGYYRNRTFYATYVKERLQEQKKNMDDILTIVNNSSVAKIFTVISIVDVTSEVFTGKSLLVPFAKNAVNNIKSYLQFAFPNLIDLVTNSPLPAEVQKNDVEDMCEKATELLENRNLGKEAENTARKEFISSLNRVIEDFESEITREKIELQALETELQNITEQEERLSNINNKTTDLQATDIQTDMKLEQIEQLQGKKITLEKKRIQLEINIEELQAKKICVENLLANNVELFDYLEVDEKLFKRTQKILEHLEKFKNILQNASEKRKKAGDSSREIDLLLKTIEDFSNAAAEEIYTRDAIIADFAVAKPGSEEKLEEALQLSSSEKSHDLKGIEFITKEQIEELELKMLGVLSPEELNELTTFEKESLTVDTSTDKVKLPIAESQDT